MKPQPFSQTACNQQLNALDDALYVIGGKWKLRIIGALRHAGIGRFNELQRSLTGISARVLSNELKELEMNGFVKRIVYTQTPTAIEYVLTDYADTLEDILGALINWGEKHRVKIREEHRAKSDLTSRQIKIEE